MYRILLLTVLVSCAYHSQDILLNRTDLSKQSSRTEYVTQYGADFSPEVKNAFIEGSVMEGMLQQSVVDLYGYPDERNMWGDIWIYKSNEKIILVVSFAKNMKRQMIVYTVRYY